MPGKKGLGEVHKVGDGVVAAVSPETGELEAVGSFLDAAAAADPALLDVVESCSVGVIFGVCAVGDHEDLDILIEPGFRPKAVPLVAVDLVESLLEGHATALQLHMDQRQTVD